MFKKAFIAAIALAVTTFTAVAQETVRIGLAAEPYAPFSIKQPDGQWTGFEIELQKAVCAKIEVNCVITEMAYAGLIPALQNKKIDVIWSTMAVTEERAKVIDFGVRHLLTPKVFVGPKSDTTKLDFDNPELVKGKTFGVQKATAFVPYLQKYFPSAEIKQFATTNDAILDLRAGRVDFTGADIMIIKPFLESDDGKNFEIKATAKADPILTSGSAIGYRKEDSGLREKIDTAIKELKADGGYDAIAKKYFDFDPYGN